MEVLVQSGKKILRQLLDAGYQAFFVGGFVRDQYLDMPSSDIDITTNALPETIESLFDHTIPTGKKYGTITVLMDDIAFEVTTYRVDDLYTNHRQPKSVKFSEQLREDLIRRDFTMNALVQDIDGQIIDLFDGKKDIDDRLIRAINNPLERFKEDALRILRAIRFVGKLGFNIESKTLAAMKEDAHLLSLLPTERILKEMAMILDQAHISKVYGLLDLINLGKVFEDLKQGIDFLKDTNLSLTLEELFALSHFPHKVLNTHKWRFSNKQVKEIEGILNLMNVLKNQRLTPVLAYNHDQALMLSADKLLTNFYHESSQKDKIINLYRHLLIDSYQDLAISGQDIKHLAKKQRHVGLIIEKLIEEVLYERIENNSDALLKYAKKVAEALDGTD